MLAADYWLHPAADPYTIATISSGVHFFSQGSMQVPRRVMNGSKHHKQPRGSDCSSSGCMVWVVMMKGQRERRDAIAGRGQ